MSKTIDERVVEMRFDNAQFERNVSTSMSTLDRLKQSLDFSGLSLGLDAVGAKFTAFEAIAVGALMNIGAKAADVGVQLVKSLSVDQISAGWEKFGEKTRAVGTLISQGFDISTVNEQMERLNWFTDETSYNFTDMAREIGKFTSTGKSLEDSVTAVEGIALWAALSGKNAGDASRAMYQLSQAMGAGVLRYQDWQQAAVNLNMNTVEFMQHAVDAAKALGTLRDNGDGTYDAINRVTGSIEQAGLTFNQLFSSDGLTKGLWFQSDVMMKVFTEYAGAVDQIYEYAEAHNITASEAMEALGIQLDEFALKAFKAGQEARTWADVIDSVKDAVSTGWMNTFQNIVGDYKEATELYTQLANELYDVFAEGGNVRNEILAAWKPLAEGGREDLVEAFWNIFHAITGIVQAIREAAGEVFTPFFSEVKDGANWIAEIVKRLKSFSEGLQIVNQDTGELTETGEKFKSTFKGIFSVFGIVLDVVSAFVKPIGSIFKGLGTGVIDLTGSIGDMIVKFREAIQQSGVLQTISERLSVAFEAVGTVIRVVCEGLRDIINGDFSGVTKVFEGILMGLAGVVGGILNIDVSGIKQKISEAFDWINTHIDWNKINETFSTVFNTLKDTLSSIIPGIRSAFKGLNDVLTPGVQKAKEALDSMGNVDTSKISAFSDKVKGFFEPLIGFFKKVGEFFRTAWDFIKRMAEEISPIAKTVADKISSFLQNASLEDIVNVLKGIIHFVIGNDIHQGITGFNDFGESLTKFVDSLTKTVEQFGKISKAWKREVDSQMLLNIGITIGILAASIYALSKIDWEKAWPAVATIGALAAEMVIALKMISKIKDADTAKAAGVAILEMSAALLIMSFAIKSIAGLDFAAMGTAVAALSLLFVVIAASAKQMASSADADALRASGSAMLAFAAAVLVLSLAIKMISKVEAERLWESWAIVSLLLAELVASAILLSKHADNDIPKGAATVLALAAAVLILASAVKSLGKLELSSLAKGVGGVAVLVAALAIAVNSINKVDSKDVLAKAVMLIAFSSAIKKLGKVVEQLSGLSFVELAKGLLGIVVLVGAIVAAVNLMKNTKEGSASLAVAAAAVLVLAISLKALGSLDAGTIAKGLAGIAGAFVIIGAAGYLLTPVAGAITLLAKSFALIGVGVLAFCSGINLLVKAMLLFAENEERFVAAAEGFGKVLSTVIYSLMESFVNLALNALTEIIQAKVDIIKSFVMIILDAARECLPELIEGIVTLITDLFQSLAKHADEINGAFKTILESLVNNLNGFDVQAILNAMAAVGLLTALMTEMVLLSAVSLVALATLPIIGMLLGDFMEAAKPFLDEIKMVGTDSMQGAKLLAETILILTGASVLDSITAWFRGGKDRYKDFGEQIAAFAPYIKQYADCVKDINPETVEASANAALALSALANNLPNEGGWISKLVGDNTLANFATELVPFGEAFAQYAEKIKDIDPATVTASANAAKTLADMASIIPNQGGTIADLFGDNTLVDFATGLKAFAEPFVDYAKLVTSDEINFDRVKNSATAISSLITAFSEIPNQGGAIAELFGDNTLADFAVGLNAFAPEFIAYAKLMNDDEVNIARVKTSAAAIGALITAFAEIPNQGGAIADLFGDNTLTQFAAELNAFAPEFVSYAKAMNSDEVNVARVKTSAAAISALITAFAEIPNQGGAIAKLFGDNTLSQFATELNAFAPEFVSYAKEMNNDEVNIARVKTSAAAIEALIVAFSSIPYTEGLMNAFSGSQDLVKFASGLKAFAPEFVSFAKDINTDTIDVGKVENAANAIAVLITAFSNLPETGGLAAKLDGDQSLTVFAQGLNQFIVPFKTFASYLNGDDAIDLNKVEQASGAITSVVNAFANLPLTGGLAQVFSGDQNLIEFAAGLKSFGAEFVGYAKAINAEGVDMSLVTESATAIQALVAVGNALQDSDVENWHELADLAIALSGFSGPFMTFATNVTGISEKVGEVAAAGNALSSIVNTIVNLPEYEGETDGLTDFADAMAEFAPKIKSYCDNISQIKAGELSPVVQTLDDLVKMAIGMSSVDPNAVSNFGTALVNLGTTGIEGLIAAFTDGKLRVDEAVLNLISSMIEIANQKTSMVLASGRTLANKFVEGFHSKIGQAVAEVSNILNKMLSTIGREYQNFFNCGKNLAQNVANGASSSSAQSSMTSAGERLASALKSGLQNQNSIYQAKQGASSLVDAAENQLESLESYNAFYNAGAYLAGAFAKGLSDNKVKTNQAASDLANSAASAASGSAKPDTRGLAEALRRASDYFQNESDLEPRITPVLDLTNVRSGMNRLNSYMSRRTAMSVSSYMNGDYDSEIQNGSSGERGTAINFVQNNYSPKALSRIEIYRQTRNQLSMMKGLVRKR